MRDAHPFETKNIKPFIHLKSPIINEQELISLKESEIKSKTISSLFDVDEGIEGFEKNTQMKFVN